MGYHTRTTATVDAWFVLVLLMVLALTLPHVTVSEASGCTNATIAGAYGLTATGAIFAPNGARSDIALVGRTVYDGQGRLERDSD